MQDSGGAGEGGQDAITRNTEDLAAGMQLTAYWEATGDLGDIDSGLCTPREVHPLGLDCPRKIITCTINTRDVAGAKLESAHNLDESDLLLSAVSNLLQTLLFPYFKHRSWVPS